MACFEKSRGVREATGLLCFGCARLSRAGNIAAFQRNLRSETKIDMLGRLGNWEMISLNLISGS